MVTSEFAAHKTRIDALDLGQAEHRRGPWRAAVLLTAIAATPAYATGAITGEVVDGQGHPVAGALVGSSFSLSPRPGGTKVQIGYGQAAVASNSRGSFLIPPDLAATIEYSTVIVAEGPDGSLGFAAKSAAGPNQIRLSVPARLTITVAKHFGHPRTNYSFDLLANGSAIGYGDVTGGSSTFLAPPGSLELTVSESESKTVTRPVVLAPSIASEVRLRLQPTVWAGLIGKPAPPLAPTDVQNWPTGQSFGALRGKWVLVDFWATWCQPCVAEMPKLIKFYRDHSGDRSRFEIIAIHSPDGKSFAAIGDPYQRLKQKVWSGESLPFPLLFDSEGATHRAWGIETYPTVLLLDPAGNMVGEGTLDDLAKKIGL